MPRWTAPMRLTEENFRKLLDAHLFVSLDIDDKGSSVMRCSCGASLNCDRVSQPERKYRDHLSKELEKFAQNIVANCAASNSGLRT